MTTACVCVWGGGGLCIFCQRANDGLMKTRWRGSSWGSSSNITWVVTDSSMLMVSGVMVSGVMVSEADHHLSSSTMRTVLLQRGGDIEARGEVTLSCERCWNLSLFLFILS